MEEEKKGKKSLLIMIRNNIFMHNSINSNAIHKQEYRKQRHRRHTNWRRWKHGSKNKRNSCKGRRKLLICEFARKPWGTMYS